MVNLREFAHHARGPQQKVLSEEFGSGGFVVKALPGEFHKVAGAVGGVFSYGSTLLMQLPLYLLHTRQHALQGAIDLLGFVGAAFVHPQFEDIAGGPEHAEGGVATLVGGVHRTDGLIGLLYPTLPPQVENIFYRQFW